MYNIVRAYVRGYVLTCLNVRTDVRTYILCLFTDNTHVRTYVRTHVRTYVRTYVRMSSERSEVRAKRGSLPDWEVGQRGAWECSLHSQDLENAEVLER